MTPAPGLVEVAHCAPVLLINGRISVPLSLGIALRQKVHHRFPLHRKHGSAIITPILAGFR